MVSTSDISAYYRGALSLLHFVEARRPTGRRFGSEADARWSAFVGDLTTADRLDLLIRDADAEWPGAFGAATVFGLRGVAVDEAFGAEWSSIDPVEAEEVWRAARAPSSLGAALDAIASSWSLELTAVRVGALNPAEKIVVAGPAAIAAVIAAFAEGKDLDWAAQVTCIATPPAHRQLAAAATALLNENRRATLLTALDAPLANRTVIVSPDAHADDAALARSIEASR